MLIEQKSSYQQRTRLMQPRLPDEWGRALFNEAAVSAGTQASPFEQDPASSCSGMWQFCPATGEAVLGLAAMAVWRSSQQKLALSELLNRVHVQDRPVIRAAFASYGALRGSDFQFRLMASRERMIWIYFSPFSPNPNILRAWCVDVTRHIEPHAF